MEKLKLSDVRTKLPFRINRGTSIFSINDILRYKDYEIDFDVYLPTKGKNLQRGFVWTLLQKQELILSVLKEIELPVITVIHYDHKIFKVIDGKQRLSTWIAFVKGEFPITWNNKIYYFNDLDPTAQYPLLHTFIKADVGYEYPDELISDDHKIAWFELINFAGTPQDLDHLKDLKS